MLHEFVVNEETRQLSARFFALLKQEYHGEPDEELPILFSILLQTAMIRKHHAMRVLHYNDTQVKFDSMAEFLSVMRLFHKDEKLRGCSCTRANIHAYPCFYCHIFISWICRCVFVRE